MKKIYTILVSFLISSACFAQTIIEMEKDGGVYKVPCKVNGVKMKFIFDSGAATVCISESMADYLYENGYITLDDISGFGKSQVADGRIVENVRINLRDIEIAGMHLHNVEGVVILGLNGSLLLGQSAIQALGRVTIDGDRLVIHNASQSFSDNQIEYLRSEGARLFELGDYPAAIIHFRKLYNSDACNMEDLYGYACSLYRDKQYDESLVIAKKWIDMYDADAPAWMRYSTYFRLAKCYSYSKTMASPDEAIKWMQRYIQLASAYIEEGEEKDKGICEAYGFIAGEYFDLEQYYAAKEYYEKAFNLRLSYYDCNTPKDIKKIKDKDLGKWAFFIMSCYIYMDDYATGLKALVISARLGCDDAIRHCNNMKIKY